MHVVGGQNRPVAAAINIALASDVLVVKKFEGEKR